MMKMWACLISLFPSTSTANLSPARWGASKRVGSSFCRMNGEDWTFTPDLFHGLEIIPGLSRVSPQRCWGCALILEPDTLKTDNTWGWSERDGVTGCDEIRCDTVNLIRAPDLRRAPVLHRFWGCSFYPSSSFYWKSSLWHLLSNINTPLLSLTADWPLSSRWRH